MMDWSEMKNTKLIKSCIAYINEIEKLKEEVKELTGKLGVSGRLLHDFDRFHKYYALNNKELKEENRNLKKKVGNLGDALDDMRESYYAKMNLLQDISDLLEKKDDC